MTLRNQAQALDIVITRELPAPGAATPTMFDPLTGVPLPGPAAQTVSQTIPARRFDPPVRDEVQASSGSYFGLNDSRYLVRAGPHESLDDQRHLRRRKREHSARSRDQECPAAGPHRGRAPGADRADLGPCGPSTPARAVVVGRWLRVWTGARPAPYAPGGRS